MLLHFLGKKKIWWIICSIFVFFCLSIIPAKRAINISVVENDQYVDVDSMLGHKVTLLCEHSENEVTSPADYNFVILAVSNHGRSFITICNCKGIYIYPKFFVGGAVQEYNWGNRNLFVFNGTLEKATAADGVDFEDAYKLILSSWDIVYPVYHWEGYLHPDINFYKRNLFILDYLIPNL